MINVVALAGNAVADPIVRATNLLDKSNELSERRAKEHGGQDPVKEKFLNDYSKKTKGKKHPSLIMKKNYESNRVKVEY